MGILEHLPDNWFSTRGNFAPSPLPICQHFQLSQLGGGMLLASSAQYLLMYRTATHTKNSQPKMSIALRLRNPALANVYIHR